MAIKGSYNYKGIQIPEAYARIVNINAKHKESAKIQVMFYVDQNLANAGIDNAHYILDTRFFDCPVYDYSTTLQTSFYDYLKTLQLFDGWENC
jgi:hypothetical protein